jgi:integrase
VLHELVHDASNHAHPAAVRESLRRAGHKVGLHLNPHQLRHWYATTLLSRGVPLIVVSRQMRHSDPSVTLRTYAQANDAVEIHQVFG